MIGELANSTIEGRSTIKVEDHRKLWLTIPPRDKQHYVSDANFHCLLSWRRCTLEQVPRA